ncbi:MAG: flagellar basal-body rod protein FlgF [Pseudomonadota bacterium]
MDNAAFIVLSRQKTLFTAMENIANNVANTNTPGFKSDNMLFQEFLMENIVSQEELAFAHDVSNYKDLSQSSLTSTKRQLDVSLQGEGYFILESPLGTRYTRAGNFVRDAEGFVTSKEGYYVLGNAGERIVLQPEDTIIEIDSDGFVEASGAIVGQIGIVTFPNQNELEKLGGSMFTYDEENGAPFIPENTAIVQGFLEESNVNSITEITRMIDNSRKVGTTAGFINDINELQRRAFNSITEIK